MVTIMEKRHVPTRLHPDQKFLQGTWSFGKFCKNRKKHNLRALPGICHLYIQQRKAPTEPKDPLIFDVALAANQVSRVRFCHLVFRYVESLHTRHFPTGEDFGDISVAIVDLEGHINQGLDRVVESV